MSKYWQENVTSCKVVFGFFFQNRIFQTKIFNLGLETESISKAKGNFSLDYALEQEYFSMVVFHPVLFSPTTPWLTF